MTKRIRKPPWLAVLCGSLMIASASPPVIGVARSRGAFLINHASVPGTATILEGTYVQTTDTPSNLTLWNGERVELASNSSATVRQDRLILDRGMAELNGSSRYRIETKNLRIEAASASTHLRVAVGMANRVQVAVLGGNAEVRNPQGLLVAQVLSGMALQLQPASPSSVQLTGTVNSQGGKFFLTDDTTKVRVELRGSSLKTLVGKHVRIAGVVVAGEQAAAGASQVVAVSQATVVSAVAGAGGAAAGAGVSSGLSTATIAVIGGAAATAGTVGGLWAADVIGGSSSTVSR